MKKSLRTVIFAALAFFLLVPVSSFASDLREKFDNMEGAVLEKNPDGSIKKVYALGDAVLLFGDARDVRTAKKKAIMRAKAEIAKVIKEHVKLEMELKELEKTDALNDTDGNLSATRKDLETFREEIVNNADAALKGVVVLDMKVDYDAKLVKAVVGTGENNMRAADDLKDKMERNLIKDSENKSKPYSNFEPGSGVERWTSDAYNDL